MVSDEVNLSTMAEEAALAAVVLRAMAKEFAPDSESAMLFQQWSDGNLNFANQARRYIAANFDPGMKTDRIVF